MIVAGIQLRVNREDRKKNLQKAEEWIEKAAAEGAQIVCLQEFFATGGFIEEPNPKHFALAETDKGETITRMSRLAKKLGIWMIVPLFEHDSAVIGRYYNSALVLAPDGRINGKYRKQFVPLGLYYEKFYFAPGNLGTPVFKTPELTFGIMICYDRHFFELPRIMALRGAQLIFITNSTFRAPGISNTWKSDILSIASNQCVYVLGINSTGFEDGIDQFGLSMAADPNGMVLSTLGEEEGIIAVDILPEKVREARLAHPYLRDLRRDTLEELLSLYAC